MAVSRAEVTLDLPAEDDTYAAESSPDTVLGADTIIRVGLTAAGDEYDGYVRFILPSKPDDAVGQPTDIRLRLYLVLTDGDGNPRTMRISQSLQEPIDESTLTYNDKPFGIFTLTTKVLDGTSTGLWIEIDVTTELQDLLLWGGDIGFKLDRSANYDNDDFDSFRTKEGQIGFPPTLRIKYDQTEPDNIEELTIEPFEDDATQPLISWKQSEDADFSHYELWRKVGAAAWAQVGSNITEKGTTAFVDDTGGITENNLILYRIRTERSDGAYNESGEVWMIRPDVSTFTVSDLTPDVLQELTFTVTATAVASTPTPVTNDWYKYFFGTSAQDDSSSSRVTDLTRTHKYPYAGSQTPSMQIENSLGFKSDATNLTTGGPALTVADIAPIAIIRASPVKVGFDVIIRFFGDESYAPAGNKELASSNAYEWDKDHSGAFVADDTTTVPYQDYSWSSGDGAGTKVVALRVKDEDNDYATHVEISVEVVAIATTDLDSVFSDGFEFIDTELGRTIIRQQGIETKKIHRGSEELVPVAIGGFAFTDTDVDGTPDDIEILEDIVTNNKRIQITIYETVRFGAIERFSTHTEGGWDDKYNWTATIVLE